jgi:anti-sigma B factor antagonist
MALRVSVLKKEGEGVTILSLQGSLDTETHQELRDKIKLQLAEAPHALVLDLELLDYISSMGISAIIEASRMAEDAGTTFMISNVPEHINQVFKIVKALPKVAIFENMEEADQYLLEMQKRYKKASPMN